MAAPTVLAALKVAVKSKTVWENKDTIIKLVFGVIAAFFIIIIVIAFILLGGFSFNFNVPSTTISKTYDFLNSRIDYDSSINEDTFPRLLAIGSLKTVSFTNSDFNINEAYTVLSHGGDSLKEYLGDTEKQYKELYKSYKSLFSELIKVNTWIETITITEEVEVINPKTKEKEIKIITTTININHRKLDYNFCFPVNGSYSFSNTWGNRRGDKEARYHQGTDILSEKGTPVVAVFDGVVNNEGWNGLGGWSMMVSTNNNIRLYYAHFMERSTLRNGDKVSKGQVIGYVGNSGSGGDGVPEGTYAAGSYHLHLGMQIKGNRGKYQWINPYEYCKFFESSQGGGIN